MGMILKFYNGKKCVCSKKGFTLIEVLVVIGIVAILSAIVLVAINPARQFKIARDSQRTANIAAILDALGQNISEHKGIFTCGTTEFVLPSIPKKIAAVGGADIASCISPTYISSLPFDPSNGAFFTSNTDYDTGYSVSRDGDGRITITAQSEISSTPLSITR